MKKVFYDVNDLIEMTGYKSSKCSEIIRELNIRLEERYKEKGKEIITFKGRIPIWYFDEITSINKNEEKDLI